MSLKCVLKMVKGKFILTAFYHNKEMISYFKNELFYF